MRLHGHAAAVHEVRRHPGVLGSRTSRLHDGGAPNHDGALARLLHDGGGCASSHWLREVSDGDGRTSSASPMVRT